MYFDKVSAAHFISVTLKCFDMVVLIRFYLFYVCNINLKINKRIFFHGK